MCSPLLAFLTIPPHLPTPIFLLLSSSLPPLPILSSLTSPQYPFGPPKMSRRSSRVSSDEELSELVAKLQSLLPPESRRRSSSRASVAKLLKETCNHIRSLHREVDGLSDQLCDLMSTMDSDSAQAEVVRSLLRS